MDMTRRSIQEAANLIEECAGLASRQAGHAATNLFRAQQLSRYAGLETKALELKALCDELEGLQQRISIASSVSAQDMRSAS